MKTFKEWVREQHLNEDDGDDLANVLQGITGILGAVGEWFLYMLLIDYITKQEPGTTGGGVLQAGWEAMKSLLGLPSAAMSKVKSLWSSLAPEQKKELIAKAQQAQQDPKVRQKFDQAHQELQQRQGQYQQLGHQRYTQR